MWNDDDVTDLMRAGLFSGSATPAKYAVLPNPMYATFQYDAIIRGGQNVGVSQWVAYTANAGSLISLSLVDVAHSEPGTEVKVLWGEPNTRRSTPWRSTRCARFGRRWPRRRTSRR